MSLRTFAPIAGGLTIASVLYGDPRLVLATFASVLVPATANPLSTALLVTMMVSLAHATAPRLAHGTAGWVCHLPASETSRRWAHSAGLIASNGPWTLLLMAASLLHPDTGLIRVLGLAVLSVAAAATAQPNRGALSRTLALVAAVAAALGTGPGLVIATLMTILAGRLPTSKRDRKDRLITAAPPPQRWVAAALSFRWLWRATGRRLLGLTLIAPLCLIPPAFFIVNNQLSPAHQSLALRFGALIAQVLTLTAAVDLFRRHRATWAWSRSLPWSARFRVLFDAAMLGLLAAPTSLLVLVIDPLAGVAVMATLLLLAARASGAVRSPSRRAEGATTEFLAEGLLLTLLVTVAPLSSVLMLLAVPTAIKHSARAERRVLASAWNELEAAADSDHEEWAA